MGYGGRRYLHALISGLLGVLLAVGVLAPASADPVFGCSGDPGCGWWLGGEVTDETGSPVGGATVELWKKPDGASDWVLVDSATSAGHNGSFAVHDLTSATSFGPNGDFTVVARYSDPYGEVVAYLGEESTSLEDAGTVKIEEGAENCSDYGDGSEARCTLAQALLLPVSQIDLTGRVVDLAGADEADATVILWHFVDGEWVQQDQTTTDGDGAYSFAGLRRSATWTVSASASDDEGSYEDFLEDATALAEVDGLEIPVEAAGGEYSVPEDLILDTDRVAAIAGAVTDLSGAPANGAAVTLYRLVDGAWAYRDSVTADEDGGYSFPDRKRSGTWTVSAGTGDDEGSYEDFLGGAATLADATGFEIPVDRSGGTYVVDEDLVLGIDRVTDLSGSVLDHEGNPAAGADVTLYRWVDDAWTYRASVSADEDGTYSFGSRKLAGRWTVTASWSGRTAFYGDAASLEDSDGFQIPSESAGLSYELGDLTVPGPTQVRVTVTGLDGAPASGGWVNLYHPDGSELLWDAWSYVDEDGTATFLVDADRDYSVGYYDPSAGWETFLGGSADWQDAETFSVEFGQTEDIALQVVDHDADVTVTVVDEEGDPIPGAYVGIVDPEASPLPIYGYADEDGQLTFSYVRREHPYLLAALVDGGITYWPSATNVDDALELVVPADAEEPYVVDPPITVDTRTAEVRGSVVDEGEPAVSAQVDLLRWTPIGWNPVDYTYSDEHGDFSFDAPVAEGYTVRVSGADGTTYYGDTSDSSGAATFDITASDLDDGVDLDPVVLQAPADTTLLRAHVVSTSGRPLTGASVEVFTEGGSYMGTATKGAGNAFRYRVARGATYTLTASYDGQSASTSVTVPVDADPLTELADLEIDLPGRVWITGTAETSLGDPAGGSTASLWQWSTDWHYWYVLRTVPVGADGGFSFDAVGERGIQTVSVSDGTHQVYLGGVTSTNHPELEIVDFGDVEGDVLALGDTLVLPVWTTATGSIFVEGDPGVWQWARIWRLDDAGEWTLQDEVSTGPDETYSVDVDRAGTYTVSIQVWDNGLGQWVEYFLGGASDADAADIFEVPDTGPVTLPTLSYTAPALVDLRVQVVDEEGEPLGSQWVTLLSDAGGFVSWASTDGDGWVTFEDVRAGSSYAASVDRDLISYFWGGGEDGGSAGRIVVPGDTAASYTVDDPLVVDTRSTTVGGQVRTVEGPTEASVTLLRRAGEYWNQVGYGSTDEDGAYEFANVPLTGTFTVRIMTPNAETFYLGGGSDLDEAETFELTGEELPDGYDVGTTTIVPAPVTMVSGSVVTDGGEPLGGVHVMATDAMAMTAGEDVTAQDGTFSFPLRAGATYYVNVQVRGYPSQHLDLTIPADPEPTTELDPFVFDATGTTVVTGLLTDQDGNPLADRPVTLWNGDYFMAWWYWYDARVVTTDEDGRFAIVGVPDGTYTLSAEGDSGTTYYLGGASNATSAEHITLDESSPAPYTIETPLEIDVDQSAELTGRVVDGSDDGVDDVQVTLYARDGDDWDVVDSDWTGSAGGYHFWDLVRGTTYTVGVRSRGVTVYLGGATSIDEADTVVADSAAVEADDLVLDLRTVSVSVPVVDGSGDPLESGELTAYIDDGGGFTSVDGAEFEEGDGGIGVLTLVAGVTYKVRAESRGALGYWGGGDSLATAGDLLVPADAEDDLLLGEPITIGGARTTLVGSVLVNRGSPAGFEVSLMRFVDGGWHIASYTETDVNGDYAFEGVQVGGSYTVGAYIGDIGEYVYLGGATDLDDVEPFVVPDDAGTEYQVDDLSLTLEQRTRLSGLVIDATGGPLEDATVEVYVHRDWGWDAVTETYTDGDGRFLTSRLPIGEDYVLRASYDGEVAYSGGGDSLDTATPTSVPDDPSVPEVTDVADLVISLGGRAKLTGRVLVPGGDAFPGAEVTLLRWYGDEVGGYWGDVDETESGDDGSFAFSLVRVPGTYTIQAAADGRSVYLGDAADGDDADTVVLAAEDAGTTIPVGDLHLTSRCGSASRGAVISNGVVSLGVNCLGELNYNEVGLKFNATGNDSTFPGCECEGWGVADRRSEVTGYANDSTGISNNLELVSFTTTASTATSVVRFDDTFEVTHDYRPAAASPNLYAVTVTVRNIGTTRTELRYRRVMDWDIEPTAFDEYVTMVKGSSPELVFTSNDGFASANPLVGPSDIGLTGSWADEGPDDHGALFDFDFGDLVGGDSKTFTTLYGAAGDETTMLAALTSAGAEAYSLGQPSTTHGPDLGTPNTFAFGFVGVGGSTLLHPPVAHDDEVTTTIEHAVDIDVLANDTDADGDALTLVSVGPASHGTATIHDGVVTYTPDDAFAGDDSFTYVVSDGVSTDTGTVEVSVFSAPAAEVTAPPVISGPAKVGVPITTTVGTWDPVTGVAFTYRWLRNGVPIEGATTQSYTPRAADIGSGTLRVRVTGTRPGYQPVPVVSDAVDVATGDALVNTILPGITEVVRYGDTVRTNAGAWTPTADSFGYQWLRDGAPIPGAASVSYRVGSADVGHELRVRVTAIRAGHADGTADSATTTVLPGAAPTVIRRPEITGRPAAGGALSIDTGVWSLSGLSFRYQWSVDGTPIGGATSATFTVPADAPSGTVIGATVTATKDGHTPGSAGASPLTVSNAPTNTALPTISGLPKVGETLTASPGSWTPASGLTYTYSWQASYGVFGWSIPVGSGPELVVPDWAAGYRLFVSVTATDGSSATTARSAATSAVQDIPTIFADSPATSSSLPQAGHASSVAPVLWFAYEGGVERRFTGAEVTPTYRWFVDGVQAGNSPTFTPTVGDVGKWLSVEVTAARSGFRSGTTWAYPGRILSEDVVVVALTLRVQTPAPVRRVDHASVTVCSDETGSCQWATTDDDGEATVPVVGRVAGAPHTVWVYPPAGLISTSRGISVGGDATQLETVEVLPVVTVPPTVDMTATSATNGAVPVDVDGDGDTDGSYPVVFVSNEQRLTAHGCAGRSGARWTVTFANGSTQVGGLTEGDPGVYTGLIPGFEATGMATISTNVPAVCEGEPAAFTVYIDPRGIVTDQYGVPLTGAAVTLMRRVGDEFLAVDDGDTAVMDPEVNTANPSFTNDIGFFRWDVKAGDYRLAVSGATSGEADCDPLTTGAMGIPPERLDLLLRLSCPGAEPPAPITSPSVGGETAVGDELTAVEGTWGNEVETQQVEWLRNGSVVGTGATYTVTAADSAADLVMRTTARRPDYVQEHDGTVSFSSFTYDVPVEQPLYATTAPSVSGTGRAGQTLEATTGAWSRSGVSTSYQWFRGEDEIDDATEDSYLLTTADKGAEVWVRVTATRGGSLAGSADSAAIAVEDKPLSTGVPTITGTPKVGEGLTATPGTWDEVGVTLSYQWLRNGDPIPGAGASTYSLVADDLAGAAEVAVRVVATRTVGGVQSAPASSAAVTVGLGVAPVASTLPTVSGTAIAGQTLHATAGSWPADFTTSPQWLRNGDPILGATGDSYQLTMADKGAAIRVRVKASRTGWENGFAQSVAVTVEDKPLSTGVPSISGTPKVGETLTASAGTWDESGLTHSYQWLRNGSPITGATTATYVPHADDLVGAAQLAVRVVAARAGGVQSAPATSTAVTVQRGPAPTASVGPAVSGTPVVGQTLSATAGTWPAGVTTSLQWLRDGSPIAGASGTSYVLLAADVGRAVSVRVTGSRAGYTDGTAVSEPVKVTDRLTATVKVKVAKKVKRASFPISVTVAGGAYPATGKVTITFKLKKSKVSLSATLVHGVAKLTVKKKLKKAGTYLVTATYAGDALHKSAMSKVIKVKVK